MVADRVKAAMGFRRSPAMPKTSSTTSSRKTSAPAPSQHAVPVPAVARPQKPTPGQQPSGQCSPAPPSSGGKGGGSSFPCSFARYFGVYFPRSSAQVQPACAATTPEAAELSRLIEELQERESRLRTELLEHKILKETVVIVPFLETEL
ncbi:hypothetical protein CFC21_102713, partial [Triticum aestivum]